MRTSPSTEGSRQRLQWRLKKENKNEAPAVSRQPAKAYKNDTRSYKKNLDRRDAQDRVMSGVGGAGTKMDELLRAMAGTR